MARLILLTFGFLGWAWYEMSGGDDFVAGENGVRLLAKVEEMPLEERGDADAVVARADTAAPLVDVASADTAPDAKIEQASVLTDKVVAEPGSDKIAALAGVVATDASPEPVVSDMDYRVVTGNRVNLRNGPGTEFSVVAQLIRGNEVEVLRDDGTGWVKLRALEGNRVGWMSGKFLDEAGL